MELVIIFFIGQAWYWVYCAGYIPRSGATNSQITQITLTESGGLFPMEYLVWLFDLTVICIPNAHPLIIQLILIQPYHARRLRLMVCKCTYFVTSFILSISTWIGKYLIFGVVDHWQNQTDQIFNMIPFQMEISRFIIIVSNYDHNMYVFWHGVARIFVHTERPPDIGCKGTLSTSYQICDYICMWRIPIMNISEQSVESFRKVCQLVFSRYRNQRGVKRLKDAIHKILLVTSPLIRLN